MFSESNFLLDNFYSSSVVSFSDGFYYNYGETDYFYSSLDFSLSWSESKLFSALSSSSMSKLSIERLLALFFIFLANS